MDPLPQIVFILIFIILGGFFSLFETALSSSHKTRLRVLAVKNKKYEKALEAAEDPRYLLAAVRIWITILRILIGALAGYYVAENRNLWLDAWNRLATYGNDLAVVAVIAGVTLAAIILGDIIPRLIALTAPEHITAACLPLIRIFAVICRPAVVVAAWVSAFVRKAFHVHSRNPGITEDELMTALDEGEKSGVVESRERTMVEGVFYLGDRPVGTFMNHRSEIQWLDINAGADEIRTKAKSNSGQGCFPVADGTLDNIIGSVFTDDLLLALLDGLDGGLRSIMRKALFVPETMPALKAFEAFKRGEADYLFVMDEYGGFAGILSLRNLIEEIVELTDTGETEEISAQDDGTWIAGGTVNIDDVSKALSLSDLAGEHQDYHTLAGFILSLAEEVPRAGASFESSGYRFTVTKMDGNRIDKIKIEKLL
jgi:putative hemolysin